jgi:hypothetical protein
MNASAQFAPGRLQIDKRHSNHRHDELLSAWPVERLAELAGAAVAHRAVRRMRCRLSAVARVRRSAAVMGLGPATIGLP